jgi:signal transduction histidine kinase
VRTPDESHGASRQAFTAMWRSQLVAWHAVYAVIWSATTIIVLLEHPGRHGKGAMLAGLVAIAVNYAVLGRRALLTGHSTWGVGYHVIGWGLLCLGMWLDPEAELWLFLWALFPHLWSMLSRRGAILGSVAAVVALGLTRWGILSFDRGHLTQILVTFIGSLGLSLAVGLFIDRLVREAESRAETIDELNATRAQLAGVERDRGIRDERERLSREIHDTLAQGFTSVLALTRAADAALGRGDVDTARARLSLLESTAADNLKEARLIVAELTPGHLESRTLPEALARLIATVQESGGVEATLDVSGQPVALGGAKEVVLLRAAQEGLGNVRRHARASHVRVHLAYAGTAVTLTVADDGVGFAVGACDGGSGLDGLRARSAEVGGTLDVTSTLGQGTTLTVGLPTASPESQRPPHLAVRGVDDTGSVSLTPRTGEGVGAS